jgi:phosphopantothenoylcysteine decarboxylase/phosphopantothenate--cysteine ligase
MSRILLGVSGGIAAYKAVEFVRLATKAGHGVRVLMSANASRFIGAATFEGITGAPVLTSEFDPDPTGGTFPGEKRPDHDPISHLEIVGNADCFLVAPASAGTLAKLAGGFADSMLTTGFIACTAPRLVAPAMNDKMYRDPAVLANVETLRSRGVMICEPNSGDLASRGEYGVGRMQEPEELLAVVESVVPRPSGSWDGMNVLVSAGGTREPLDAVRFLGNRSSGKMGVALAEEALRRGASVTLIAANVALEVAPGIERVDVETTAQMSDALTERFDATDVLLMAAAPADFTPAGYPASGKLSREEGSRGLQLEPTSDILAGLGARRRESQTLIGFAAEVGDGIERARQKLSRKRVDAIVFNDVSRPEIGFDSAENEVLILDSEGETFVPRASKASVASAVLDRVDQIRSRPSGSPFGPERFRSH